MESGSPRDARMSGVANAGFSSAAATSWMPAMRRIEVIRNNIEGYALAEDVDSCKGWCGGAKQRIQALSTLKRPWMWGAGRVSLGGSEPIRPPKKDAQHNREPEEATIVGLGN